ncbi:MAG TPA: shikimate dehydrogenase [Allosphingosinicella sp.]
MPEQYAEVIGDPVAHSLSPAIHNRWIEMLRLDAHYQATRVTSGELIPFLAQRRGDPDWRGCNVTAPHKQAVAKLVDRLTPAAERIGAVNCVYRDGDSLVGANTDLAGVAAALSAADIAGRKAVILGAGGAAAPAVDHLLDRGAAEIVLMVRDPARADVLGRRAPDCVRTAPFTGEAIAGASVVINATPLGLEGRTAMPDAVLAALSTAAPGATVLDMVYRPERTPLLEAADAAGLRPVSGLIMLVEQARPAVELFFGRPAPA